jgi:hypothetical protein
MRGLILRIYGSSVFILQLFPSYIFTQASVLYSLCCIVNVSVYWSVYF